MLFSCASPKDVKSVFDRGIFNVLISYHYIQKHKRQVEEEILPRLKENNGIFMTDSGAFTIRQANYSKQIKDLYKPTDYEGYIEEYVKWCFDFRNHIYCIANMDMDNYVGREVVVDWNDKYFRPLEKDVNVIYNALRDFEKRYNDLSGFKRLEEYCSMYDYVGVNASMVKTADKVYQIAKRHKARLHGFAWTSFPTLMKYPMFSVDSSTWSAGQRFGATFVDDGKNFYRKDYAKHIRKSKKFYCQDRGLDFDELMKDTNEGIKNYSIEAWKGFIREYQKISNLKLWNKPVRHYDKRRP